MTKTAFDEDIYWLEPDTVPTMGDYFRTAGYRTFYKGKWHISHADLHVPGTQDALPTNDEDGNPILENIEAYLEADPLDENGFSGWIGPEPLGAAEANTGYVRDPGIADQTIELLDQLEAEQESDSEQDPWLAVCSFVNAHDIRLFGLLWRRFGFPVSDDTVPKVPNAPTRRENLSSKPQCQKSYVETYRKMLLRQPTLKRHRKLYYYAHKLVDQQYSESMRN